nr:MAG TPA: hypothetical protein [Caudoviricetes sp.]
MAWLLEELAKTTLRGVAPTVNPRVPSRHPVTA